MDISKSATLLRRKSLMMCSTSPNFFCFGQAWGNVKNVVGYSPVDLEWLNASNIGLAKIGNLGH
jgi:hypothetical protein